MKLLNLWSQNLSVGLAVAACVSPAFAEGTPLKGGNAFKPASFASMTKDATEFDKANSMPPASPYALAGYQMATYQDAAYSGQGYVSPAAYASAGGQCDMVAEPGCGVAEQFAPCGCGDCVSGAAGDGLLGNGMLMRHHSACGPECGQGCGCGFGGGLADRLNGGCGPLGCNGGTFGDGRSLRSLFGGCQGRLRGLLAAILTPYGEGGVASQRWFDFSAEATAFRRDSSTGLFNFTSQGLGTNDFVLTSNSVDLDRLRAGLALQANIQVGPGSNLEAVYFGLNKWSESASVSSNPANSPTLYSYVSNFGTAPFNGFDDTDRSFTQSLNYESAFHNGEVNFRRRWVEPSGFLQGSFLAGIRYFQLDETLVFSARGSNNNTAADNGLRFFDSETSTKNQLTGFQIGADLWANLVPGIKVGTELKSGVYGNHAVQQTRIFANSLGSGQSFGIPAINESVSDGRTAYLTQCSVTGIYRLTYAWTLKGSGQLLYIDNVALAPENVNTQQPGFINQARTLSVRNDGEVLYTGFTVGAEYTW